MSSFFRFMERAIHVVSIGFLVYGLYSLYRLGVVLPPSGQKYLLDGLVRWLPLMAVGLAIVQVLTLVGYHRLRTDETKSRSPSKPATRGTLTQVPVSDANTVEDKLKRIVSSARIMGVQIASESIQINKRLKDSFDTAMAQKEESDDLTRVNEKTMRQIVGSMNSVCEMLRHFKSTMNELNQNAENIQKIIELIKGISFQTNILSLNAAVEAARAGQAGVGFAVVAEEVKNLAGRVNKATEDISEKIKSLKSNVDKTTASNEEIMTFTEATRTEAEAAAEEIYQKVRAITDMSTRVAGDMQQALDYSVGLTRHTEQMQEMTTHARIGYGQFEKILTLANHYRSCIREKLDAIYREDVDIFDENYKPVPDTNPPKFTTCFDHLTDKELQPVFDEALKTIPGAIYALAVDRNGYLPTHHKQNQQPLTGDYDYDLLHSREKRLYVNNETEKRRCKNKDPFLLQTYLRDTGEILNDLSLPLIIDNKHWGAFIIGVTPAELQKA